MLHYEYDLRWSETKNLKTLITDNFFLLPLDGSDTLYTHRTQEYISNTEVEIFLTVIVSMVTVIKLTKKYLKASFQERLMKEYE